MCTNRHRHRISPGRYSGEETVSSIRTIRGWTPMMGDAVVVRNAESATRQSTGRWSRRTRRAAGFRSLFPQVAKRCCQLLRDPPPPGLLIGSYLLLVSSLLSAMQSLGVCGYSWGPANDGCGRGSPQCGVGMCPGPAASSARAGLCCTSRPAGVYLYWPVR